MEIVTGYTGRSHITPSLDASINVSIFGKNNVVLNFGDKLSFSSQTLGRIVIGSGALCFSGRIAVSENSEEKEYSVPATGEYSHCKIVARYKKLVSDGTNQESISLVLLQSVDSATSASSALNLSVSEYDVNSISSGTTGADFVLYDFVVSESGVVTSTVDAKKFKAVDSIVSLAQSTDNDVASLNGDFDELAKSVQTNKNAISSHETRITANEGSIKTNNTRIADNSSKIKDLQNYKIKMIYESTSYQDEEYRIDELDRQSLLLFVVNGKIPFICDFSKISFPNSNVSTSETMTNGDYTLTFSVLFIGGVYKLDIYEFLQRKFVKKTYDNVSTGLTNKITIESLAVEEKKIDFDNLTIYRLMKS